MDEKKVNEILNALLPRKKDIQKCEWTFTKILTSIVVLIWTSVIILSSYLVLNNFINPFGLLNQIEPVVYIVFGGYFGKSGLENFIKMRDKTGGKKDDN